MTIAQAHRTAAKQHPRSIALFGGSFDPIHSGHLAVARAADRRFNFDEVHFIAASRPPHKLKQHLAPFPHRFAMVALAAIFFFFVDQIIGVGIRALFGMSV